MAWDVDLRHIEPERIHTCEAGEHLQAETAAARSTEASEALWGHAATRIERAGGRWWAHNEECSTRVEFCPWCGSKLEP